MDLMFFFSAHLRHMRTVFKTRARLSPSSQDKICTDSSEAQTEEPEVNLVSSATWLHACSHMENPSASPQWPSIGKTKPTTSDSGWQMAELRGLETCALWHWLKSNTCHFWGSVWSSSPEYIALWGALPEGSLKLVQTHIHIVTDSWNLLCSSIGSGRGGTHRLV